MARPREFDEAEVIDRARNAFWSRGVAATSVSDLSEATGISVGSIYKAFTSKDDLCRLTLDDYLRNARTWLASEIEAAPAPWDGIRAWLAALISQATDTSPTRGCYAVELAAERAAVDDRIRALLVDHDDAMRELVAAAARDAIETGQGGGQPGRSRPPDSHDGERPPGRCPQGPDRAGGPPSDRHAPRPP